MLITRGAVALKSPYHFFLQTVPSPPRQWTKVGKTATCGSRKTGHEVRLKWMPSELGCKDTAFILPRFEATLRGLYWRKIALPADESNLASLQPKEYLSALLQPVADLCNQLHLPHVLRKPMRSVSVRLCDTIYGATFVAEDLDRWKEGVPFIVSVPDTLFEGHGTVSLAAQEALSKAMEHSPDALSIIATDFKDIAVFSPPTSGRPPWYEKMSTSQPALALRILSAAFLVQRLPPGFIIRPEIDIEIDTDLILPEGPPQDPDQPLSPDEVVFATHHTNSDFDVATLIRDRRRASQFFRWHMQVNARYSKVVAHPDDVLSGKTNEAGQAAPTMNMRPICPFDVSKIPADTSETIELMKRESPLAAAGIAEQLSQSKSFAVVILDVIAEGSKHGICTVYRCRITTVNGEPVSSPPLCLKLFDDRFFPLEPPEEETDDTQSVEGGLRWFDKLIFAEGYAAGEALNYEKLRPVQGSIVPWFYGIHQFTLPDGTVLCGLLMEYIEGWQLDSEYTRTMSAERQISVIRSCRHGVRTLDIADVSQRDWHPGQMILTTNPRSKVDHAVFIDFAMVTQTWEPDEVNFLANYTNVLRVLLGGEGDVGIDPELVWQYYDKPDAWHLGVYSTRTPGGERVSVRADGMFPFITWD